MPTRIKSENISMKNVKDQVRIKGRRMRVWSQIKNANYRVQDQIHCEILFNTHNLILVRIKDQILTKVRDENR